MVDFYTDAQYGDVFGYYSRGRVLLNDGDEEATARIANHSTETFAHYTTFPMALSPHFASIMCRKLFLMWVAQGYPSSFTVLEFGAGSGQLAVDIRDNCLEESRASDFNRIVTFWNPHVMAKFRRAAKYMTVERSPALAKRQRNRGITVVQGDAQLVHPTCEIVKDGIKAAIGNERFAVNKGVVISNELLDAFAPSKLRLTGEDLRLCGSWQETLIVHFISKFKLLQLYTSLEGEEKARESVNEIEKRSSYVLASLFSSPVVRAAEAILTGSDGRLHVPALVNTVQALVDRAGDLKLPLSAEDLILRLQTDSALRSRVVDLYYAERATLAKILIAEGSISDQDVPLYLDRDAYRSLRFLFQAKEPQEVVLVNSILSKRYQAPLSDCSLYRPWIDRHSRLIQTVRSHYRALGHSAVQFSVRLGEEKFMQLADCVLNGMGFVLSIDYGASFEALASSMSSNPLEDGVAVPPIPPFLVKAGLRSDCQSNWLACPGFIDLTSFVDFTNVAYSGNELGWETLLYGPQSAIERTSEVAPDDLKTVPPIYALHAHAGPRIQRRHIISWYGFENLPGVQRWTSFKVLIQSKGITDHKMKELVLEGFENLPLAMQEVNPCWELDSTAYPQIDYMVRRPSGFSELMSGQLRYDKLQELYNDLYEESHLYVQMIDWLTARLGEAGVCQAESMKKLSNTDLSTCPWVQIWGIGKVKKVLEAINGKVFTRTEGLQEPGVCLARKKLNKVCG